MIIEILRILAEKIVVRDEDLISSFNAKVPVVSK